MLNTFPTLLIFSLLVPTIFRIVIALFLFGLVRAIGDKILLTNYFVNNRYPAARFLGTFFQLGLIACGILIMIGLYTQVISLVAIYFLLTLANINKEVRISKHSSSAFNLVALLCFSLLFLGAGRLAFDLPL